MYLPKHHLYPTNSQILHHLVLELFVLAPQHEKQERPFFSLVMAGPMYKYGGFLSAQRKQIFQSHPDYKTLVVIAGSELPEDTSLLVTSDDVLHAFFGAIQLDPKNYVKSATVNDELFSSHAKGLEAQLPFIRGYKHFDNVVPYIVNTSLSQAEINNILDEITAYHGNDACYVFVEPEQGVEKFVEYVEGE